MDKYINWDETWQVLEDRDRDRIDETTAFNRLINIFKQAHGSYLLQNGKIVFRENYDLMDYRYSTSVIGSDNKDWKVEQSKKLSDRINEERDVLAFYLDRINSTFKSYSPIFLELLYDRYFDDMTVREILKKREINNKRYYYVIESSEYLFKEATLILKPSPQITEHIEMLEKRAKERQIKLVNSWAEKILSVDFDDEETIKTIK
ncbi:hypothetical protein [Breznakia pachnodae]|uniref:Uncharacterized protein n=1 Tax=Breznakia pachnodae TaxID=265178 RepID=A0ABU0E8L2_9FIRM|nr:hypothetical protein [Breznakia pachnodae]MDQ0363238.1 hypothetical protein [Breznakia pachnodae]